MKLLTFSALLLLLPRSTFSQQVLRRSPPYPYEFQFALPISPVKTPLATYTNPTTGIPIDFYEITIRKSTRRFFPNLRDSPIIGYDGLFPGPTFRISKGRETVIRYINNGDLDASVHLHGSNTRSPWDGAPEDRIRPGEFKDYYYGNSASPRTLWYHDHAAFLTTRNVYAGQKGVYIIQDAALDTRLGLPQGRYDVPLMLGAMFFTPDGEVSDESAERTSVYGDTFTVNGQILPFMDVEPRKYRFRLVNAAVSRTFNLTLRYGGNTVPVTVVGSDGGLRQNPVVTESLVVAMAERWEVVVDFAGFRGRNLTLGHRSLWADTDYEGTDKVMQFRVGNTVSDNTGNGAVPGTLVDLKLPVNIASLPEKTFNFNRFIGSGWVINGRSFDDLLSRILANPPLGTVEKWLFRGAGGWSHPIHAHLIDFVLIDRGVGNPNQPRGRLQLEEYEKNTLKDVAAVGENEQVTVLARFAPWPGVYTFHCHNIVHEDFAMMAAFNISTLADFGYPITGFEDPLDPRFRAKPYIGTDLADVRNNLLPFFASLKAYPDVQEVERRVEEYYAAQTRTQSSTSTVRPQTTSRTATVTRSATTATTLPVTSITPQSSGTPRPDQRCGREFNNAPCGGGPTVCCSKYGWCGAGEAYCNVDRGCQSNCNTVGPPTRNGQCGRGGRGATCVGWVDGECCSQHSWCGGGPAYCGAGCQNGPCLEI